MYCIILYYIIYTFHCINSVPARVTQKYNCQAFHTHSHFHPLKPPVLCQYILCYTIHCFDSELCVVLAHLK